jgi:hypothetical protein
MHSFPMIIDGHYHGRLILKGKITILFQGSTNRKEILPKDRFCLIPGRNTLKEMM